MSPSLRPLLLGGLVLTALLATGCEPPPVKPTQDKRQQQQTSRIEGQVVAQTARRGNAVLFLYDVRSLPPPQGAGRPVSFTVIPQEQLFGSAPAGAYGPFTANYTFSLVPAGSYVVRGFIDADTCPTGASPCHAPDFIPWYYVTGEPNALDVGGAAVVLGTVPPRPLVVTIAEKPEGEPLEAVTGVNVSFSEAATLEDRPAFSVDLAASDTQFIRGTGMQLVLKPQVLQSGLVNQSLATFTVRYEDATGTGKPEVWPRIVVRKLSEGTEGADKATLDAQRLLFENDLDNNGVLDPKSDLTLDYTQDGIPDQVVLTTTLMLEGNVQDKLKAPGDVVRGVPSLRVLVTSMAYASDARPMVPAVPLPSVPPGRYAITLVQSTGQTWRLPNDFSRVSPEAPESGQGFVIDVK